MPALVEHLRARLGAHAVYGLRRVSEHRPENCAGRENGEHDAQYLMTITRESVDAIVIK